MRRSASGDPPSAWFKLNGKDFLCIDWAGCDGWATVCSLAAPALSSHQYWRTASRLLFPSFTQPWCKGGWTSHHWLSMLLICKADVTGLTDPVQLNNELTFLTLFLVNIMQGELRSIWIHLRTGFCMQKRSISSSPPLKAVLSLHYSVSSTLNWCCRAYKKRP